MLRFKTYESMNHSALKGLSYAHKLFTWDRFIAIQPQSLSVGAFESLFLQAKRLCLISNLENSLLLTTCLFLIKSRKSSSRSEPLTIL